MTQATGHCNVVSAVWLPSGIGLHKPEQKIRTLNREVKTDPFSPRGWVQMAAVQRELSCRKTPKGAGTYTHSHAHASVRKTEI